MVMLLKKYDKANVSSYALIVQKKQKALQCLLAVYNWHGPSTAHLIWSISVEVLQAI